MIHFCIEGNLNCNILHSTAHICILCQSFVQSQVQRNARFWNSHRALWFCESPLHLNICCFPGILRFSTKFRGVFAVSLQTHSIYALPDLQWKFLYRFFNQDLWFLSCIFDWVVCWGFVCFDRCNCCEKQSEVSFSGFTILSPIPLCFDIDRRLRGNFGDDGSEGFVCPNTKRPPIIRRLWAERFDIWWGDDNCGRW